MKVTTIDAKTTAKILQLYQSGKRQAEIAAILSVPVAMVAAVLDWRT